MATVKEKPKSQAQIDRERAARKRHKEKRQAARDAEILSRAAGATKAPAPLKKKRVAQTVDSQEIAGLRAEIERLQTEIKRLRGVILSQNESAAKLIQERDAIANYTKIT